jgi:hypothetical protein
MDVYQTLDWTGEDEWLILKFSHRAHGGKLTTKILQELLIGTVMGPKIKEALLSTLSNREYAVSSTSMELITISDEVEPPHHIRLESGHKVWKDRVFRIPKKLKFPSTGR